MTFKVTAPINPVVEENNRLRLTMSEIRSDVSRVTNLRELTTQVDKLTEIVETLLKKSS